MVTPGTNAVLRTAAAAAIVASVGDVLMLSVAHSHNPFTGESSRTILLWLGGTLGVAAVPVYYFGYTAAVRLLRPAAACARLIKAGGGLAAILGALMHGLTAIDIYDAFATGRGVRLPTEPLADMSNPIVYCALLAAVGGFVATTCIVVTGVRNYRRETRLVAFLNPVSLTIAFGALAVFNESLHAYFPVIPNLGHFLFFILLARSSIPGASDR